MKNSFYFGGLLGIVYLVITIYLFLTAQEMEILLAFNFAIVGLIVLLVYFMFVLLYTKMKYGKIISTIILVIILSIIVFFFFN